MPHLLPDIDKAITRLRAAIDGQERIAVYGDFDVDGVTATAILTEGLRGLGASVQSFIPNRFRDGYGVNTQALGALADQGVRLVITVDCGVTALSEADYAHRLGLDLIVLDHHEVASALPVAVAVIDPKRSDSRYPTHDLCSGALALRLLEALYDATGRPLELERYLDLAALATVCDMVPLQGENRALVKAGLMALARTQRPGLRALLRASGAGNDPPDATTLGYRLGPRLNAAGRLGDASLALEALMTSDPGRADQIAQELGNLNGQRQQMVEVALALTQDLVGREAADAPVLVVGHPDISRGIVGLIASRLVETYQRPAFVYEESESGCVGSARGTSGFDVVAALSTAADVLTRYGGHRAAGGFALDRVHLSTFKQRLNQSALTQLQGDGGAPPLEIDAEAPLRSIDARTRDFLIRFEPHGIGNPAPLIMSRAVRVHERHSVGGGKHLMMNLRDGTTAWRAIAFGRGAEPPALGAEIDIVYCIEKASRGYGPRLRIVDWRSFHPREREHERVSDG